MRRNLMLGKLNFLYETDLEINKWFFYDDISWWLYVYDTYEMMAIEYGKIKKKVISMKMEPYGFHRLKNNNECLVVSYHSPCVWKPWKYGLPEGMCSSESDA